MPKMLNGVEVPTKGRIVWVRNQEEQGYREYPAIVIDAEDPTALIDVHFFSRSGDYPGFNTPHESEPGLSDGQLRWRWPPREEQPAKPPRVAPSCHLCPHTAHVGTICAEAVDWHEQCGCSVPGVAAPAVAATIATEEQAERRELRAVIAKLRADIDGFIVEQDKLIAERNELQSQLTMVQKDRDKATEQCAMLVASTEDNRRAKRLANKVTLDTQSAEEAMTAVLSLLDEARRLAYDLAVYGSPLCPASSTHDREWIAKVWNERRAAAILFGAPAPREG